LGQQDKELGGTRVETWLYGIFAVLQRIRLGFCRTDGDANPDLSKGGSLARKDRATLS
jgi:hypothetical protein